jgi:hypothetical protein
MLPAAPVVVPLEGEPVLGLPPALEDAPPIPPLAPAFDAVFSFG